MKKISPVLIILPINILSVCVKNLDANQTVEKMIAEKETQKIIISSILGCSKSRVMGQVEKVSLPERKILNVFKLLVSGLDYQ